MSGHVDALFRSPQIPVTFFCTPSLASGVFVSNRCYLWAAAATVPKSSESWKYPGVYTMLGWPSAKD